MTTGTPEYVDDPRNAAILISVNGALLPREKAVVSGFDSGFVLGDGVHIRLMVTRGVKRTPYQDPRVTIGPATVVIIPEHKLPKPEVIETGITLFTVHIRRTGPAEQDQKLNSHSKLNCILACIQAT